MFPTRIYTKYATTSSLQLVLNTALELSKVGEAEFVLQSPKLAPSVQKRGKSAVTYSKSKSHASMLKHVVK